MRHSHGTRNGAVATLSATMVLVSAIGAGTDAAGTEAPSAEDCVAGAEAFMADWNDPPTELALEPLAARPEPGGHIIKLAIGSVPSEMVGIEDHKKIAEALGWTSEVIVYDGTVEDLNAKLHQAVDAHPTIITIAGQSPSVMQQPLQAAADAGIVVVVSSTGATPEPPTSFPGYSGNFLGLDNGFEASDIMANWVLRDSGCAANALVVVVELGMVSEMGQRVVDDLETQCADCNGTLVSVLPQDIGTPAMINALLSALQADPSIDYVVAPLSNLAAGLVPALEQAGIEPKTIIGAVPDETALHALQDGTNAMMVNLSINMISWMEIDTGLRALEAQAPISQPYFPLAVLDTENVPDGDAMPTYPADYEEQFLGLWHVD